MYRDVNVMQCGGVELRGLKASLAPRRGAQPGSEPKLEKYTFVPYENVTSTEQARSGAMQVCVHLALENMQALKIKAAELVPATAVDSEDLLTTQIVNVIDQEPMIHVSCSDVKNAMETVQSS